MFKKLKFNYYFLYLYIFITPLFFSLLFQRQREEDFVFCLVSSFLFVLPAYLFKNIKPYLLISSVFLFFTGFFDLTHIYLYQGRISSSIFFIILDTNPTESSEFLSSNITMGLIGALFIYTLGFALLLMKSIKIQNNYFKKGFSLKLLSILILPFMVKFISSSYSVEKTVDAYTRSNQFFLMGKTYFSYREQMKIFTEFKDSMQQDLDVKRLESIDEDETHVLVIGESTTSRHMGIYGYHRDTTPLLGKRKNDLIIFNDVVNSHPPGTASNLRKIGTLANTADESREKLSVSLVNIMKALDFKTYWLSNQLILGVHDTVTTALAKQADVPVFTNTTDSKTYDEKLLPILDKKLNEKVKKKFIVVHLLGTHMKYRNRYPDEFKQFNTTADVPKQPFHTEEQLSYINEYDNAILYNDYIMDEILKRLERVNGIVSLFYFSDHGEEVYETKPLHGHPSVDTRGIYEIPFLFWGSNEFKNRFSRKYSDLKRSSNIPFAHDDLIHALIDLYLIDAKFFDPKLSFFNPSFYVRPRYVDKIPRKSLGNKNEP